MAVGSGKALLAAKEVCYLPFTLLNLSASQPPSPSFAGYVSDLAYLDSSALKN